MSNTLDAEAVDNLGVEGGSLESPSLIRLFSINASESYNINIFLGGLTFFAMSVVDYLLEELIWGDTRHRLIMFQKEKSLHVTSVILDFQQQEIYQLIS